MGGGLMQLVAYGAKMYILQVTLKLLFGKYLTDAIQILLWNLLNKHSTVKPISAAVLHAQSAEMVILHTEHTYK